MKKTILAVTALLLAGSVVFTSCKKDDITDPVVTLNGNSEMTVSLQGTFTDPGATADDNKDGKITPTISGSVNTNLKGTYTITYQATDAAGNSGSVTRTVNVVNDADGINGTYAVGGTQTSGPGAGATYSYTQTITASSTRNNRVVFGKLGNYVGNTSIYADVLGVNLDMPSQTGVLVGNPPTNRTFQGTGTKSNTTITLNYTEVTAASTIGTTEIMTKQ
jgi:hypothetical protein